MRSKPGYSASFSILCALVVGPLSGCDGPSDSDDLTDYCAQPPPDAPDQDDDGLVDACDNCRSVANDNQQDLDRDGDGDACDDDRDSDGFLDEADNCPALLHPNQNDSDGDGLGDPCDAAPRDEDESDRDEDGMSDLVDLCPGRADAQSLDSDGDGIGDDCDNCPQGPNASQGDADQDGIGDECDARAFNVAELSVAELLSALESSEITCEQVVEQTLTHIQRFDLDTGFGAPINALVAFNLSLREQALERDREFAETGDLVGPLHCVPLVIKDNYDSSDTPTSNGSLALVGTQAPDDGYAVGKLRKAGAILIGTSAMDEFAQGVSGISSRSGRTGNAYDTSHNPGGSSGGSSAAVAASFAVLGTGTDNCSSLTLPASYHGLVTFRPTYGLVSQDGVFPSNRLDATAGPITRSLADLALALDQMAGEDKNDPRTKGAKRPTTYTDALSPGGLKGKRIGIVRAIDEGDERRFPFGGTPAESFSVFARALDDMAALGATLVDNIILSDVTITRSSGGFADLADAYFASVDSPYENYEQMCDSELYPTYIWKNAKACRDAYGRSLGRGVDSEGYQSAEARYLRNRDAIAALMDELSLDGLLYPVDAFGSARVTAVASNCGLSAVSGLPTLAFQVGWSSDLAPLPVSMQLLGRAFAESELLSLAYDYEQAKRWRRAPDLRSSRAETDLSALDLAAANERRLAIGEAAFEQVLQDGDRAGLSSAIFRDIVRKVTTRLGMD